jgi:hypothetical protein
LQCSAFNTLYAINHKFYGCIDSFLGAAARTMDRSLVDGMASATVGLPGNMSIGLDGLAFRLQQDLPIDAERLIGRELDPNLPVGLGIGQLAPGYIAFRNGPAAAVIGPGREQEWSHWGYLQATVSFGGGVAPLR